MTNRETIESLQFIVITHRAEFEARRALQFKAISGVFVLMGVAMMARVNDKTHAVIGSLPDCMIYSALGLIVFSSSMFIFFAHSANAFNKSVAHRSEKAIQDTINGELQLPLDLYLKQSQQGLLAMFKVGNGGYWGWLFESIIILVFAIITAWVLTS
ncbi:hypothetical protein HJ202_24340 [Vibrio parahaemolyticus]|nr:hypothetical protein [Vibrio parahaemolyticus]